MPKIPFNVDAYTAKLIGRENVSNLEGAILELVKNTYDADATVCLLYYDDISESLYIGDNGTGMTSEVIKRHWMTIGSSSKKNFFKSRKGRVQTGAKGIGRFALDRVADKCSLLTVSENQRLTWSVDWSAFEFGQKITEVTAELNETELTFNDFVSEAHSAILKNFVNNQFEITGSIFKLSALRDKWDGAVIRNICLNLKTLIPPELRDVFNIYFFDNYTSESDAAVLQDDADFAYDYKIEFQVYEQGRVHIALSRNEFDLRDDFEAVINDAEFDHNDRLYFKNTPRIFESNYSVILKSKSNLNNSIGDFSGVFYFSKVAPAAKDERDKFYHKEMRDRRDASSSFGGIRIYRDQFRVRPYGDAGTSSADWLMLSNRKAKSPAGPSHPDGKWRVDARQIFGSIHISRTNLKLQDQANRQGFVETAEFSLLKDFLRNIIEYIETDRQYVYRKLDSLYKMKNPTKKIEKALQEYKKTSHKHGDSSSLRISEVAELIDSKDKQIQQLQDELQTLRVLATTGIVTNTYVHEIRGETDSLKSKLVLAENALTTGKEVGKVLKHISRAKEILTYFTSWFKVTVEAIRRDKRTRKKVDLKNIVDNVIDNWKIVLTEKKVSINNKTRVSYFQCFPNDIESLFSNMITNSASLFKSSIETQNCIDIEIQDTQRGIKIEYKDNGPGLSHIYIKNPRKILEPFESDRRSDSGDVDGTGMGMWIVNKIVESYKGHIDLSGNNENSNGFHIVIYLEGKKYV